jgi:uncharacterized protein YkwD
MSFDRFARAAAALSLLSLLAACGGGGDAAAPSPAPAPGSSPTPSPSPAPTPAPSPGPSPSPSPAPSGVLSTCGLPDFQAALLARINQLRAAGASCGTAGNFAPTGMVAWNGLLTQAADGHSRDMATQNYFSHTSLDGRSMSDRIDATGYRWSRLGENIAAGYPSVDAVMNGWIGSAGHCANLMNPSFTEVGVACVPRVGSATYSHYWTMDLGTPR